MQEQPSLTLADNEQTAQTQKNVQLKESSYRKMLFIKRYTLKGIIHSSDRQQFAILFSQLTTHIMEWYQKRTKQCGQLVLELNISPNMKEQASSMMEELQQSDSHFDFLKKIQVTVQVKHPDQE